MKQFYQAYKQQSIMTMTQSEMLIMLYDGILRQVQVIKRAFAKSPPDFAEINVSLQKTQKILNYLIGSLDKKFAIANNLLSLYDYCNWLLTQTNIKKTPVGLDEIDEIIRELKDTYIQADKNVRMHVPDEERTLQTAAH